MLIYPDGTVRRVAPANGKEWTLDEIHRHIDGLMEIVYLPEGDVMLVNENGIMEGKQHNRFATIIGFGLCTLEPPLTTVGIVGTVLLTDFLELGETDLINSTGVSGSGVFRGLGKQ